MMYEAELKAAIQYFLDKATKWEARFIENSQILGYQVDWTHPLGPGKLAIEMLDLAANIEAILESGRPELIRSMYWDLVARGYIKEEKKTMT